jgi:cytochrome c-type biogenesis protein CcmH
LARLDELKASAVVARKMTGKGPVMRKPPSIVRLVAVAWLLVFACAGGLAHAVEPDEILSDPALEARARTLSAELRCLVCQNQSIDDSNAPLARDLRLLVRERLKAGESDSQIMDYIVARYGEFVLLRPRFGGANIVLWLSPLVILALGIWLARGVMRSRQSQAAAVLELSADDRARLAEILKEPADKDR